jgi:hypothetical protein
MRAFLLIITCMCFAPAFAQTDSAKRSVKKHIIMLDHDSNYVFQKIQTTDPADSLEHPTLTIGGYVSTYYAYYDDENAKGEFVQFPTICPRNNQFNLNMAMISLKYNSQHLRSNLTFHYGDIPQSTWPTEFNLIQEANVGYRMGKRLWLDAGFFRTHIGIESFQPRENITSSMAVLSFYEPYYLSGAKLTYDINPKWMVMIGAFNGYNEYIDNNKDKMFGFTTVYKPTDNLSFTYNFLTCDESPDKYPVERRRFYNNFYAAYHSRNWQIGAELNYGIQDHSLLVDTSKQATMMSGLIVARYNIHKKVSVHVREEYFADPDRILSGDNNIGNYIYGTTAGLEFHPFHNINMSLESRVLQSDNLIFKQGSFYTNRRMEFIACIDLWF